jgi:hypothetical protein
MAIRFLVLATIPDTELLSKRFTIRLGPSAVFGHGLQGRTGGGSASAWTFRFGFSHTGAGLCFQARADVNKIIVHLRVARRRILRVSLRLIQKLILRSAAQRNQGQREQQCDSGRGDFCFAVDRVGHVSSSEQARSEGQ